MPRLNKYNKQMAAAKHINYKERNCSVFLLFKPMIMLEYQQTRPVFYGWSLYLFLLLFYFVSMAKGEKKGGRKGEHFPCCLLNNLKEHYT